jgi:hypothetical protein
MIIKNYDLLLFDLGVIQNKHKGNQFICNKMTNYMLLVKTTTSMILVKTTLMVSTGDNLTQISEIFVKCCLHNEIQ